MRQKLRRLKTDDNLLLLHTNMQAGHGGASGRYDYLKEIAFDHAFLLWQLGVEKMQRWGYRTPRSACEKAEINIFGFSGIAVVGDAVSLAGREEEIRLQSMLAGVEIPVTTVGGIEFVMRAALNDPALRRQESGRRAEWSKAGAR